MPAELDPLSQVYNSLWAQVSGSIRMQSLLRQGNFIKFNQQQRTSPEKAEIGDTDLPELQLTVSQAQANLRANSSSSRILVRFEFWLSTGDVSAIRGLLPVLFAIYTSLAGWPAQMLGGPDPLSGLTGTPLLWKGKRFVTRVDLTDATSGLTDAEKNRGVRGFSAIWACEVEMYVGTTDLIQSASEEG